MVEPLDADPDAAIAHAEAIEKLVTEAGITLEQVHHGDGIESWSVNQRAIPLGHGIRNGLEDTPVYRMVGRHATTPSVWQPPSRCSAADPFDDSWPWVSAAELQILRYGAALVRRQGHPLLCNRIQQPVAGSQYTAVRVGETPQLPRASTFDRHGRGRPRQRPDRGHDGPVQARMRPSAMGPRLGPDHGPRRNGSPCPPA